MKNTVSISLLAVCALVFCTNGWCEEKQLDPRVINDWMRSMEVSDVDKNESKRILHSTWMKDWTNSSRSHHVRYEVSNSNCQKTLSIYQTDEHGRSWTPDWLKVLEDDQEQESAQLETPRVFVTAYSRRGGTEPPIMDLDVEYQMRSGLPVLVVSDKRDVERTLLEFESNDYAIFRISAFGTKYSFRLDLTGLAEKVRWSEEHCPTDSTEMDRKEVHTESRVES